MKIEEIVAEYIVQMTVRSAYRFESKYHYILYIFLHYSMHLNGLKEN